MIVMLLCSIQFTELPQPKILAIWPKESLSQLDKEALPLIRKLEGKQPRLISISVKDLLDAKEAYIRLPDGNIVGGKIDRFPTENKNVIITLGQPTDFHDIQLIIGPRGLFMGHINDFSENGKNWLIFTRFGIYYIIEGKQ